MQNWPWFNFKPLHFQTLCVRVIMIRVLPWPPLNLKHLLLSPNKHYLHELIRLLRSRNSGRFEAYPGSGMEPISIDFFSSDLATLLKTSCHAVIAWIWNHTCFYEEKVLPIFLWLLFLYQGSATLIIITISKQNKNVRMICVCISDFSLE